MAEIVKMPKLSDTMTEGVISKWHKKVGDKVKSGDLLADIETDKATMEFESFQDGVLLHIGVQEKQAAPVDSVIAVLGKEGEDISKLLSENGTDQTKEKPSEKKEEKEKDSKPVEKFSGKKTEIPKGVEVVKMPKLSDTMTEGVVSKWHKKVGDKVKSGELLADIETDKATMEFESFQDGTLIYRGVEEGKSAPVDSVLAILGKGDEDVEAILEALKSGSGDEKETADKSKKPDTRKEEKAPPTKARVESEQKEMPAHDDRIKASPLAKALAREKNIDLKNVKGTGDNGRIIRADIENYKPSKAKGGAVVTGQEGYEDVPVSQMRKTIARRLLESKNGAPHYYLTVEVDMDNAIAARKAINELNEKTNPDVKISFNDFVIKASAAALRRHLKVNVSWMDDKIRMYSHIHIGVAVAVEDGLLVPVLRFTDLLPMSQISSQVKELSKKARDKKLQPSDWEGNTFTVSNLGMFGIESFTSIINTPESCILSVGAIRQVPVVKNNAVVPGNLMKLTLACDHRTVDGATGAAFLQTLKGFIENPVMMLV